MTKRISDILILLMIGPFVWNKAMADDITLITIGEGSTKDLSVKEALVNAVEQALGVYVSGDTHILDDELIRDEVVQIKRGNIREYTVLSQEKVEGNNYASIVESTVSVDSLLKFAESKGSECELSGRTFAANLNLKKLYIKNGAAAMNQLYHTLGYIVPQMYDYRLKLGEPVAFNEDVYVPVSVECVLNDNYSTFEEIYGSTYNHIISSIEDMPVEGVVEKENMERINRLRNSIMELPEKWIFGFIIYDNIGGEVFAVSSKAEYFWPEDKVAPYRIYNNSGKYDDQRVRFVNPSTGDSSELPARQFIVWEDFVLESHGPRIQKLDNDALCSSSEGGSGILKSFLKTAEDRFSLSRAGTAGVYDIRDFDERMVDWNDCTRQQGKYLAHQWVDDPKKKPGETVATIYFVLCYKETDIDRISDIRIKNIKEL